MGKFDNDMMRGWGYPMCDECGMPAANNANTCNTCNNTANTCGNAANTCAGYEEPCAAPAAPCQAASASDEMHIYFDSCDGMKEVAVNCNCNNDEGIGRVLDVNVKLCNACPGRASAVGVQLMEMDANGNEYARGFRAVTVPAHNASANCDVAVPTMRFILPEAVSAYQGRRHFVVRTTNHYIDQPTNCGW